MEGKEHHLNLRLVLIDDTAVVTNSEADLNKLVKEFGRVCKRRKLKVT